MAKMRIYNKRRTKYVDIEIKNPHDAKMVMNIFADNEVAFVFHILADDDQEE